VDLIRFGGVGEETPETVHVLETSGKRGIMIVKELGISDATLYHWHTEMRATDGAAFPAQGITQRWKW